MLMTLILAAAFAQSPELRVDLHLDTPTQLLTKGLQIDAEAGIEASLQRLKAGGTNVVVEVLWPPRKANHVQRTLDLLTLMEAQISRFDDLQLATTPDAARAAVSEGKIAVLLSLEGAHGLGTDADWQTMFMDLYSRGLRLIGLTWSMSNRFAGSSSDGGGGLTQEGKALVALARAKGVVLDVSHASRATTLEVCKDSPVPVIASHSNSAAITPHSRNLSDEEIRCIAQTGGVIGLNFHAPFVGTGANVTRLADHAEHMARIGGFGVVALGSDFDGYIRKPAGLADASTVPLLWDELRRRGWTSEQIRGAQGENFMRAWSRAWAARGGE